MRKPSIADPGVGQLGRLASGLLRLFDGDGQQPDYEARRDRVRGPLLQKSLSTGEDQSSSSASQ